jgi:hypothetical protein
MCNSSMLFFLFFFIVQTHSYTICSKCVHSITKGDLVHCNLFGLHPLFKNRPDVDNIGKEICTSKGKYFLNDTMICDSNIFKGNFRESK